MLPAPSFSYTASIHFYAHKKTARTAAFVRYPLTVIR